MPKVVSWTPEDWKRNLSQRLKAAQKYRELFEPQWRENINTLDNAHGQQSDQFNITFDNLIELESGEVDSGDSEVGVNYTFKNTRFLHSQLSANPPSVIARPASTDPVDTRKADAADRLVRYGFRNLDMQEHVDATSHNMLRVGLGTLKQVWDADKGDVYDFNEQTREVTMEGDHHIYSPDPFDFWLDPEARRAKEIRYTFERIIMTLDEAIFKFPDMEAQLRRAALSRTDMMKEIFDQKPQEEQEEKVAIFEYYEKAMPINGMAGRHAWCLDDGTTLRQPGKNPHYQGRIPYHLFTFIDMPGSPYGKSVVEYATRLQDMLNRLDSSILDNIQAQGVVRMAVPSGTEIEDEAVSNSAWDWIKYEGNVPPHFIDAPTLMPDMWKFREQLIVAIQDLFGINDSMLGIQRREQSAVSQQTSIEAGTMIHRRLFKKYELFVQSIFKDFLGIIRENWDEARTVLVLGKEKAFEAAEIKGADISGGFDIIVEYGASLPIDPNLRREAIMLLMEPLKEAGMSMRQILKLMKLNDLESMYDRMEMAADRQREIFEEMIARFKEGLEVLIEPADLEEHEGMLEYAYDYVMTSEFKYLDDELKEFIKEHIRMREDMAKSVRGAAEQNLPQAAPESEIPGMPGVRGAQPPILGGLLG